MSREKTTSVLLILSLVFCPEISLRSAEYKPVLTWARIQEAVENPDTLEDLEMHLGEYLNYTNRSEYEFQMRVIGDLFQDVKDNVERFTMNELMILLRIFLKVCTDYEADLARVKTHRIALSGIELGFMFSLGLTATVGEKWVKPFRNAKIDWLRKLETDAVHKRYEKLKAELDQIRAESAQQTDKARLLQAVEFEVRHKIRGGEWRGQADLTYALREVVKRLAEERKTALTPEEASRLVERVKKTVTLRSDIVRFRRDRIALGRGREFSYPQWNRPMSWLRWILVTYMGNKRISKEAERDGNIKRINLLFEEIQKGGFRSLVHQTKSGHFTSLDEAFSAVLGNNRKPGTELSELKRTELEAVSAYLTEKVKSLDNGETWKRLLDEFIEAEKAPDIHLTTKELTHRIERIVATLDEKRPKQHARPEVQAELDEFWNRFFKGQNYYLLIDDAFARVLKKPAPSAALLSGGRNATDLAQRSPEIDLVYTEALKGLKARERRAVFCYFRDKVVRLQEGASRLKVIKKSKAWPRMSLYDRMRAYGWIWAVMGGFGAASLTTYAMANYPRTWWVGGRSWFTGVSRRDPYEIVGETVGHEYLDGFIVDFKEKAGIANLSEETLEQLATMEERRLWRAEDAKEMHAVAENFKDLDMPTEAEMLGNPPPDFLAFDRVMGDLLGPEPTESKGG